jgi:hypothetical protein
MQVLVPIGSIAITGNLRKLVEGYFQLNSLGPTRVKGVSEPVGIYEVSGLGPLRTRLQRAAGRGLTRFVGREREMEAMKHAAGQARADAGNWSRTTLAPRSCCRRPLRPCGPRSPAVHEPPLRQNLVLDPCFPRWTPVGAVRDPPVLSLAGPPRACGFSGSESQPRIRKLTAS